MNNANTGWLFYKKYYHNINQDGSSNDYKQKTNQIINSQLTQTMDEITGATVVELKTTYPGLLIGSGYQHETGGENEFKVGFHFDYSTGLPVIPGSSLKGVLRSVFPFHRNDNKEEFKNPRIQYLKDQIKSITGMDVNSDRVKALEMEIFEGKVQDTENKKVQHLPISSRDIFYDSFPSKSKNKNQHFLDTDYITHHKNPIKDPNPVMFLKVLPEVEFKLQFKTENSKAIPELTADKKTELFKTIILDLGLGAKTNVGYGQFIEIPKVRVDDTLDGELERIDFRVSPNRYYFKTNLFGIVNAPYSKKLKNAESGQHFNLEIRSLNEDGSIKNISVKGKI